MRSLGRWYRRNEYEIPIVLFCVLATIWLGLFITWVWIYTTR